MNITTKLICTLAAGATLCVAAPVFADSRHGRGYEHRESNRGYNQRDYRSYNHREFRGHDRYSYRDHGRRVVVVERPYVVQREYVVQQPAYYGAQSSGYGPAAMLGAAIGNILDNQQ